MREGERQAGGSLGLAISDAVRDAASRDDSHYSLGSVLLAIVALSVAAFTAAVVRCGVG